MEGYLRLRINPWLRRLITRVFAIIPAVLVISIAGEGKVADLLVFSQVLLSLQLGFAIIPLIHFVSDRKTMGSFVIGPLVKTLSWIVAALVVYLYIRMAAGELGTYLSESYPLWAKLFLAVAGGGLVVLLAYVLLFPLVSKRPVIQSSRFHRSPTVLPDLTAIARPAYRKIAMALDFGRNDSAIIANALAHGNEDTTYLLIHITESASSRLIGMESDDYESQQDRQQLSNYVQLLRRQHYACEAVLGRTNRGREIVRIVREHEADLLVLGGHGHKGFKDWIYGETVNYVRHYVHIPVLLVK
jgi:manganese transport protein